MKPTIHPASLEPVHDALVSLLEGETWRGYFERCCFDSPEKLLAEAGRFRDAVAADGEDRTEEEVRYVLLSLAREMHPGSAAALSRVDRMGVEDGEATSKGNDGGEGSALPEGSRKSASAGGRLRLVSDGEGIPAGGARPYDDDARGFAAPIGAGDAPAPGLDDPGFSTDEDTYLVGEEHPDAGDEEAPKSAEGPTAEEEIAAARLALADLVLSDSRAWALYEKQVGQGLVGMHGRARELRKMLEEGGRVHEQGAVEVAIPELALRTHPASVAAAWERLHCRENARREYAVNERDGAVAAVVDLASKDEAIFNALTHVALDPDGPRENDLLEAARAVHAALLRRGLRFRPRGFSDHVWRALLEVFPDAPGVRWDEAWADGLMTRAGVHVGRRVDPESYDGDLPGVARAEAEVCEAYAAEDRRRYRRALRKWMAAVRDAADSGS